VEASAIRVDANVDVACVAVVDARKEKEVVFELSAEVVSIVSTVLSSVVVDSCSRVVVDAVNDSMVKIDKPGNEKDVLASKDVLQ
jgi:hypothetical protein